MRILLTLPFLAALPLAAQEFQFNLPLSGAVYDSADRSIRLVLGVPGTAHLSEPVLDNLDAASVSPDGVSALAFQDGKLVLARELRSGAPSLQDSGAGCIDLFAWSDDSEAAAALCRDTGLVQLLTAFSSTTPPNVRNIDVSSIGGRLKAFAIERKGRSIVAAFDSGGVWRIQPDEPPVLLASLGSPAAVSFNPAGDSVFAADRQGCQIVEIRNLTASPELLTFASVPEATCDPSALAFAGRGSTLLLADAAGRLIRTYDIRGRSPSGEIALDFSPTVLMPLTSGSVFLLDSSTTPNQPLHILNAAQRVAFFVPGSRRQ